MCRDALLEVTALERHQTRHNFGSVGTASMLVELQQGDSRTRIGKSEESFLKKISVPIQELLYYFPYLRASESCQIDG